MPNQTLTDWFQSPLGAYVMAREQDYFDEVVADIFGFNAMQFGLPAHDFLRTNRMPFKFSIAPESGGTLRAAGEALPVATQSMDLVVLPHVLAMVRGFFGACVRGLVFRKIHCRGAGDSFRWCA